MAVGVPRARTVRKAARGFPTITTSSTIAMGMGASRMLRGLKSIPTDTKKSTANASRMGTASRAARAAKSVRPTASPARNAPSSIDTPKTPAAATAMPMARTSTARVNSSRERVRSIFSSAHGTTDRPSTTTVTTSPTILAPARARAAPAPPPALPPPKKMGSRSSAATVRMSSTTVQPIAM